jgi:hypothetical protein
MADLKITGKIIQALALVEGVSKAGNAWKKREYVLETNDQYPRKVFFNFFGERVDQYPLNIGDEVTVSFDLESREYNGRWYTDVRAWKAEKGNTQSVGEPAQNFGMQQPPQFSNAPYNTDASFAPNPGDDSDNLPF